MNYSKEYMNRKIMKRVVDISKEDSKNFEELLRLANNEIFLKLLKTIFI